MTEQARATLLVTFSTSPDIHMALAAVKPKINSHELSVGLKGVD
jgi:hypothetical protein